MVCSASFFPGLRRVGRWDRTEKEAARIWRVARMDTTSRMRRNMAACLWKIESTDDCCAVSQLHRFFTVVPVLQRSQHTGGRVCRTSAQERVKMNGIADNSKDSWVDHECEFGACLPGRRVELMLIEKRHTLKADEGFSK